MSSGLQASLYCYHVSCLSQHSVSNMLFDVMIDRLHDVALTVESSLHFTRAAVKLVVQYGMCCGLCPGNRTGIFAVSIPATGLQ